jgi:hypothetical protein
MPESCLQVLRQQYVAMDTDEVTQLMLEAGPAYDPIEATLAFMQPDLEAQREAQSLVQVQAEVVR